MRALLAYVLAISVLLGGGYIGLRWLFEPPNAGFDQRLHGSGKVSRENKIASGKTDPNVAEQPSALGKSERLERNARSEVTNGAASVPSLEAGQDKNDSKSEPLKRSAGLEMPNGAASVPSLEAGQDKNDSKSEPLKRSAGSEMPNGPASVPSLEAGQDKNDSKSEPRSAGSEVPSGAASAPSLEAGRDKDDSRPLSHWAKDLAAGDCLPLGVTGHGELVFPIECHKLLGRDRTGRNSEPVPPTNSTTSAPAHQDDAQPRAEDMPIGPTVGGELVFPLKRHKPAGGYSETVPPTSSTSPAPTENKDQVAEAPARSVGEESPNQTSMKPPASEANPKAENSAHEAKSSNGKKGKPEKPNIRNPEPSGMMMIMKTIFPRWQS